MRRITPCLWYDGNAEDAANFYISVFRNSKITEISRYGDAGPLPKGTVLTVAFELDGQPFTALNGGPQYKFTEAVSFQIYCETQDEIDHYWNSLLARGGVESVCGWLKDRFGLSWQIVPSRMIELMQSPDPAKSRRVMEAMFKMRKIDLATLEAAANG
jgi:predicted 3-demethylubiquinone-9 3-methyltransferase (glyoxalase superfamily)